MCTCVCLYVSVCVSGRLLDLKVAERWSGSAVTRACVCLSVSVSVSVAVAVLVSASVSMSVCRADFSIRR